MWIIGASVWLFKKKSITVHGNLTVKLSQLVHDLHIWEVFLCLRSANFTRIVCTKPPTSPPTLYTILNTVSVENSSQFTVKFLNKGTFYGGIVCVFMRVTILAAVLLHYFPRLPFILLQNVLFVWHSWSMYQILCLLQTHFFSFNIIRIVIILHRSLQCVFPISIPVHNFELLVPLHFLWPFPYHCPHILRFTRTTNFYLLSDWKHVIY